jgi:4-methylaminobutanoate oxidase (formaldehyde-forming)
VQLVDLTSSKAVLSLMGPRAREVLMQVSRADLSNEAFPFATCRQIGVAGCPVLALRITYVGELGWELHMPTEFAVTVYEALMAAGKAHGLINAGYRVIESCRLEKGYRAWGSDIGPDHTPLEAGLGWAVKLGRTDKPFKGHEAVRRQQQSGVKKLLACFTLDDTAHVLLGRETIVRNGKPVGWLSSAGFGHHVGKPIGYGYVRNENGVDANYVMSGTYQLEVATELVDCTVQLTPLYDAAMQRIKC